MSAHLKRVHRLQRQDVPCIALLLLFFRLSFLFYLIFKGPSLYLVNSQGRQSAAKVLPL